MQWLAHLEAVKERQLLVLRLPADVSRTLPSRGMNMARVTVNGETRIVPVEPDGEGSHWILWQGEPWIGPAQADLEVLKEWPEPKTPNFVLKHLDPESLATWSGLTPAAKWDWIRWVLSAKLVETQEKRAQSIPSRLRAGKRRPCCFDRNQGTLTDFKV